LHFHHFLISRELGGASLAALQLADRLQGRGHRQSVWLPGPGPAREEADRRHLETRTFGVERLFSRSAIRSAAGNLGLAWALRGRGLVHVHAPILYGAMSHALRFRGRGLVRVVHVQIEESPKTLRWALRHPPELIIACAQMLVEPIREALPARLRNAPRIEAVPNPVDTDRFSPAEDKEAAKRLVGAPGGVPLVVMLANLAPHKGQETAILAIEELRRRGIPVACWLAGAERGGEGVYTARLRSLVESLGLRDQVRLLGHRADAPDLLRAADAFLLPSTREGLPLSVVEAQAAGAPVLAAPTAGVPEVVRDGQTGFLIEARDVPGYANRLDRLIREPELATRISLEGRRTVLSQASLATFAQRVEMLYRDLLG
jgi:glycosyltransferase involved in cell wall biosynthesis